MKDSYIKFNFNNFPFIMINAKAGDKKHLVFILILIVLLPFASAFLGGLLVQYLWNQSVASIFNLQDITLKQSIALLFLCKILFGFLERDWGKQEPEDDADSDKGSLTAEGKCVEITKESQDIGKQMEECKNPPQIS